MTTKFSVAVRVAVAAVLLFVEATLVPTTYGSSARPAFQRNDSRLNRSSPRTLDLADNRHLELNDDLPFDVGRPGGLGTRDPVPLTNDLYDRNPAFDRNWSVDDLSSRPNRQLRSRPELRGRDDRSFDDEAPTLRTPRTRETDLFERPTRSRTRDRQLPADEDFAPRRPRLDDFSTEPSRFEEEQPARRSPRKLIPGDNRFPPSSAEPHAEPTLEEKLSRRYSDPRVVRTMGLLTGNRAEAFYRETSTMIDARHLNPTSYTERTRNALEHLAAALSNPEFQRATNLRANPSAIRNLQQSLTEMARTLNVRDVNEGLETLRQTSNLAQRSVGLNPAAVAMEFVYGAVDTLDTYSAFVAPEKNGSPSVSLASSLVGIGVELESHPKGLRVLKALAGGPAAEATMKRGDLITAVDGRNVAGLSLAEAADLISGQEGTRVKLNIERGDMIGDVVLVRRRIEVRSVSDVRIEDSQSGVGYIKLDQFGETSAKELNDALWTLHNQGMQSLVLDLRGNPGGLLTTCVQIADMFLPEGVIVSTKGRTSSDNTQEVAQRANTWKVPLVVLIDGNSASASEILAAAIQDHGRGVVVGERSYGKGTVQTHFPLQTVAGSLKLTTAMFYAPSGRAMAGEGVTPDVKVSNRRTGDDFDADLRKALDLARDQSTRDAAEQFGARDLSTTGPRG